MLLRQVCQRAVGGVADEILVVQLEHVRRSAADGIRLQQREIIGKRCRLDVDGDALVLILERLHDLCSNPANDPARRRT